MIHLLTFKIFYINTTQWVKVWSSHILVALQCKTGRDRSRHLRLWLVERRDRSWFLRPVLDLQRDPYHHMGPEANSNYFYIFTAAGAWHVAYLAPVHGRCAVYSAIGAPSAYFISNVRVFIVHQTILEGRGWPASKTVISFAHIISYSN